MFTGIVEEKGRVLSFAKGERAWNLELAADKVLPGLKIGDSVAVNGCCLTAVSIGDDWVGFELLEETVRLTGFTELQAGAAVNLERSLRFNGEMGGHFVTGHIDCRGEIDACEKRGDDVYLHVAVPGEFQRYLIYKGSIAIEGVSLTVAEVDESGLAVWLIPHTLEVTNLSEKQSGDVVNLEFDLLGKYVERLLGEVDDRR